MLRAAARLQMEALWMLIFPVGSALAVPLTMPCLGIYSGMLSEAEGSTSMTGLVAHHARRPMA